MYSIRFNKDKHLGLMQTWLEGWGAPVPSENTLPAIGIVIYDEKQPIALAFLRKVEGGYGIFDGIVSNPQAPAELRDKALDIAIYHIGHIAKRSDINGLIAWTRDENTLSRAIRHGYVAETRTTVVAKAIPANTQ